MTDTIESLGNDELIRVIEQDNLIHLGINSEEIKKIKNKYRSNRRKLTSTLRSVIEVTSIPLDILWIVVSFVSLGAAALWIAGSIGAFILLGGVGVFICQYQRKTLMSDRDLDAIVLNHFKIKALDILIDRQRHKLGLSSLNDNNQKKDFLKSDKTISKIPSVLVGLGIGTVLATTFFWGISDILIIIGLIGAASVVTSPIGLAVALSFAATMGIYLGVMHYQAKKNKHDIKNTKSHLQDELNEKQDLYFTLKKCQLESKLEVNKHELNQKEVTWNRPFQLVTLATHSLFTKPKEPKKLSPKSQIQRSLSFP